MAALIIGNYRNLINCQYYVRVTGDDWIYRTDDVLGYVESDLGFLATTLPFSHTYSGVPYIMAMRRAATLERIRAFWIRFV